MLTTEDQIARHSFEARANSVPLKETHPQKYELRLQIELLPSDHAVIAQQPVPEIEQILKSGANPDGRSSQADDLLTGQELMTLFEVMRYAAANENVSEGWVVAGVTKLMQVSTINMIQRVDFAKAIRAVFEVLGI